MVELWAAARLERRQLSHVRWYLHRHSTSIGRVSVTGGMASAAGAVPLASLGGLRAGDAVSEHESRGTFNARNYNQKEISICKIRQSKRLLGCVPHVRIARSHVT